MFQAFSLFVLGKVKYKMFLVFLVVVGGGGWCLERPKAFVGAGGAKSPEEHRAQAASPALTDPLQREPKSR